MNKYQIAQQLLLCNTISVSTTCLFIINGAFEEYAPSSEFEDYYSTTQQQQQTEQTLNSLRINTYVITFL